jgi:hypothetical protein
MVDQPAGCVDTHENKNITHHLLQPRAYLRKQIAMFRFLKNRPQPEIISTLENNMRRNKNHVISISLLLKRKAVSGVTLSISDFTLRQHTKLPTNATTKLKNDSLSICVVLPQFVSLQRNFLGAPIKKQLMIDLQERNSRPLSCSAPACTRVTPSVLFRTRVTASTGIG